jgi:hypothetical protein
VVYQKGTATIQALYNFNKSGCWSVYILNWKGLKFHEKKQPKIRLLFTYLQRWLFCVLGTFEFNFPLLFSIRQNPTNKLNQLITWLTPNMFQCQYRFDCKLGCKWYFSTIPEFRIWFTLLWRTRRS